LSVHILVADIIFFLLDSDINSYHYKESSRADTIVYLKGKHTSLYNFILIALMVSLANEFILMYL